LTIRTQNSYEDKKQLVFLSAKNEAQKTLLERNVNQSEIDEIIFLSGEDTSKLRRLLVRKQFGEPNAYLRGSINLLGRCFQIDRRCYIPDVEATMMTERAISDMREGASVLEIGTGCGWISTSISIERPDLTVYAADIDPGALSLAKENMKLHNANVQFFESFFVDDVCIEEPDYVIANIPYGGDAEYTERELEERPQMPPISMFDPDGVIKPLMDFMQSIQDRNWTTTVYLETGYIEIERLNPLLKYCDKYQHIQDGEYGFLIMSCSSTAN
jgi:release factor glutamine methyltransferase